MNKEVRPFFIGTLLVIMLAFVSIFGLGSIKGAKDMRFGIDIRGGVEAIYEPVDLDRKPTAAELEAAKNVIETRLDASNILDREVTSDNEHGTIIVRFPWKSDEKDFNPEKAIAELGETAKLTFRDSSGKVMIDGTYVRNSEVRRNQQTNAPVVTLEFNSEGSKIFANVTKELLNKPMSIYMDEEKIFTATVSAVIKNGESVIEGIGTMDEAKDLSTKINAGALPFSMQTTNHSTISPSLGSGALNIMIKAGVIAFLFICLFMIFHYKLSGVITCIALIFQTACQLLLLSIPQFTLTLPGIAGLILSLGMAVDANIIISERIGEELNKGKSIRSAIKEGYQNAFSSVFDGNMTTGIVAIILMIFGSGTMLSFGYSLLTGVVLNFVVVAITKKLLNSVLGFRKLYDEKYFRIKKEKKVIRFYEKRYIPYIISASLLIGGILICIFKGISLDTNFVGGAMLKYSYTGEIDITKTEKAATDALNRPASIQVTTDLITKEHKMVITLAGNEGLSPEDQTKLYDELVKVNPDVSVELSESYIVEPYIGRQALENSAKAIIIASIFIVVYVAIRFSAISGISAGITALIALIHDNAIVLFVFALFGIPLNDAFVAVTLTIIGYSINDTIVIYDRIRENQKNEELSLTELLNSSVTQTIGRSINTSMATVVCIFLVFVFSYLYGIQSIVVFSLPMLFGLITGCYSTICIAGTLWVSWRRFVMKRKEAKQSKIA